jgi:virginiamycin B lyase
MDPDRLEGTTGAIGRITTGGIIAQFAVPVDDTYLNSFSKPWGITAGSDGAIWFTFNQYTIGPDLFEFPVSAKVGRITRDGSITEFTIFATDEDFQTLAPALAGITLGPDGALWFTLADIAGDEPDSIGRITTSGNLTEFPLPANDSEPRGIATGPDGAIWFTQVDSNKIGRITAAAPPTMSTPELEGGDEFFFLELLNPANTLHFESQGGIGSLDEPPPD